MPQLKSGFSLIEILVAMAVLAMLMAFMFSMVGGTIGLWEQGNGQVEAAQAARIGLNRLAEDLENAVSTTASSVTPGGVTNTNIIPFLAEANATSPRGWGSSVDSAAGSDQIFGVRVTGDPTDPLREFGYMCVYVSDPIGVSPMRGQRYYLVQHRVASGSGNFYLRNAIPPGTAWADETSATSRRSPIIDNCVRFKLEYLVTNAAGANVTTNWTSSWASQTNLPLGVVATVIGIDSRTADRVAKINGGGALSASDIDSITNSGAPSAGVQSLLRSGAVVMKRFIPFRNAR